MYKYDKRYFEQRAGETGFIRDNLEKVYRLADILAYINSNPLHRECLALKGGTAINLIIFNMPRLSVDIDLDFCRPVSRNKMLYERQRVNEDLISFLQTQGYTLNPEKGKNPHSLDSWSFWYINTAGNRDNIKVEINYSMRAHILPVTEMPLKPEILGTAQPVRVLSPLELFGSKINALMGRTATRDLYDINKMIESRVFDEHELPMLRKCFLFYYAVGSGKEFTASFDFSWIDSVNQHKIKQTLLPMLRRSDPFRLEEAQKKIKAFMTELTRLDEPEQEFLERFESREYRPELLFDDPDIIARIIDHPMALWKIRA